MRSIRSTLIGALVLTLVGAAGGLVWNELNPRGVPLVVDTERPDGTDDPAASPYWSAAKLPADDKITIAEARALLADGRVFFVDAREPERFAASRIPGAYNIYQKTFAEQAVRWVEAFKFVPPPDRAAFPDGYPVVTYCDNHTCDMAALVLKNLESMGLSNVRCLFMGLDEWIRAKHPVLVVENGEEVVKKGDELTPRSAPPVPVPAIAWLALWLAAPFGVLLLVARTMRGRPAAANAIAVFARIAIGGLFIVASWFKLVDPAEFGQMVTCYDLVPRQVLPAFVVCLPAVELLVGALLVIGLFTRPAALVVGALLVGFVLAIYSLLVRNLGCSCGCFPVAYPASWWRIYEDALFLFLTALAFWRGGFAFAIDARLRRREGGAYGGARRARRA